MIVGRKIGKFTFKDLCDNALGVVDYIELAKIFKVVYLTEIPKLNIGSRNELRRLISLIDAFYEGKVQVIITADAAPMKLLSLTDDEKTNCGFDEAFAFDRTVSRLLEMQSVAYVEGATSTHGIDRIEELCLDKSLMRAEDVLDELISYYSFKCEMVDGKEADKGSVSVDVATIAMRDVLLYLYVKHRPQFDRLVFNGDSDVPGADAARAAIDRHISLALSTSTASSSNSSKRVSKEGFRSALAPLAAAMRS